MFIVYYNLLEKIIDENGLTAVNIFNLKKGGFLTFQINSSRREWEKNVGANTSGERGVNTPALCCDSAAEPFIPSIHQKKREKNYKVGKCRTCG